VTSALAMNKMTKVNCKILDSLLKETPLFFLSVCALTCWKVCSIFCCCHCKLHKHSIDQTKVSFHNTVFIMYTASCRELKQGTDIKDINGNDLGKSKVRVHAI